jgi:tripartite-type tricarboxylate transporter receptor subunit TctC
MQPGDLRVGFTEAKADWLGQCDADVQPCAWRPKMMNYCAAATRTLIAGVLIAIARPVAAQQTYPSRPIRFIVPYAPGGTTTPLARLVGQKLTESWGQPVIVENRPGGGTMVGTEALVKSPPDGYTIMLAGGSLTLVPLLFSAPYDPIKDLVPVATFARGEFVLVTSPSVPANNLKELIAYAKSRPGQLNYATTGAGGSQHLAHELLNLVAEIKTQHIPYKGASPALTDLLGGQVQMYFSTTLTAIPLINSNRIRAMAITGESRSPALPQVPTFTESGLSGLEKVGTWYGVIAPAGTPKAIIDRMATEIGKYMAMPDFKEKLVVQGMDPVFSTPDQFAALLKADLARFTKIIKATNIKFEN